jgi:hypothetical protein
MTLFKSLCRFLADQYYDEIVRDFKVQGFDHGTKKELAKAP